MQKRSKFSTIKLFMDMKPGFDEMTNEEAGKILKAIFDYQAGEDVADRFADDDRFVRAFWGQVQEKLDFNNQHDEDKSAKLAENGRKGGLAKASNCKQSLANLAYTDTCTNTVTDTVTPTDNGVPYTETESESEDSASDPPASAAPANAAPPSVLGLGWTVEQLERKCKTNHIGLTHEGVMAFHDDMTESGWNYYGKPIRNIGASLRDFLKKHPQYGDGRSSQTNEVNASVPGTKKTPLKPPREMSTTEFCRYIFQFSDTMDEPMRNRGWTLDGMEYAVQSRDATALGNMIDDVRDALNACEEKASDYADAHNIDYCAAPYAQKKDVSGHRTRVLVHNTQPLYLLQDKVPASVFTDDEKAFMYTEWGLQFTGEDK